MSQSSCLHDRFCRRMIRLVCMMTTFVALCVPAQPAVGQIGGGGGFGGGGNNNNNQGVGGIVIETDGLVKAAFDKDDNGKLTLKRIAALAASKLPSEMNKISPLRKVSLVKMEAALKECLEAGTPVTPDFQFLAGLNRIDFVFVYPETKDLVVAGPAEGFAPNDAGRVVGTTSGRPPLRLDDLMVALRSGRDQHRFGCSIDPVPESLARFNEYLKRNSFAATPAVIENRFREMTQILGRQTVSVHGVPDDSHYGLTLVEADYRMKLISVGLERVKLKGFRSHLEMMGRSENTLQRWWFAPLYDPFQRSEQRDAYRFSGQRVQLLAQDELVDEGGKRSAAPFTKLATQKFAVQFTERYQDVAAVVPIFAELQNLFDLAVLAALLRSEGLAEKVNWSMDVLMNERRPQLVTYSVPKHVASVFNARRSSSIVLGLVAGGVEVSGSQVLRSSELAVDRTLPNSRTEARPKSDSQSWWWD